MKFHPLQVYEFYEHYQDGMDYPEFLGEVAEVQGDYQITEEQFDHLVNANVDKDIMQIMITFSWSETHPGGDNLVDIVSNILKTQREGYQICNYYGPKAEVVIVGYRGNVEVGV